MISIRGGAVDEFGRSLEEQLADDIIHNHFVDRYSHNIHEEYVSDDLYQDSEEDLPIGFAVKHRGGGPSYVVEDIPLATWHKDKAVELLEDEGYDALVDWATQDSALPDGGQEIPEQVEVHGHEYDFLGKDDEQGHLHFYRYTPEHAEVILASRDSDRELQEDDRWRLDHGDPKGRLQDYVYQQPWDQQEDIKDHGYRSLSNPEFRPDLNESLGGSLLLDGGEYVIPFRAPFGTAADILEQEAKDTNDVFVDYRPQYLELAPEDALEKYQLSPALRGSNEVTGTRIIDEVSVLDRGSEEVYTTFHVDDLAQDLFIEELSQVDGVDEELARLLITEDGDNYRNLRTVSWALTSDTTHLENTYGVDCHELFKEFGEEGIYRNEQSPESGVLQLPDRVKEELEEEEEQGQEEDTEQVGLSDF